MKQRKYDRQKVLEYANKWALSRNPNYYDYEKIGGDCTNFASQCIYAGSGVMNYNSWYYKNANSKSPSWTGVEFLYRFLIKNKGIGPYGEDVKKEKIDLGDIIQISFDGIQFAHSLLVVELNPILGLEGIKIASHTFDSFNKKVTEYNFQKIRFIHIKGVRK